MSILSSAVLIFCVYFQVSHCSSPRINFKDVNISLSYDHWDWRKQGIVSEVKDQKECAAGWAFSLVAYWESYMRMDGENVTLSEQMLIDCVDTNDGCNNGTGLKAAGYLFAVLEGLVAEKDYPYVGKKGSCQLEKGAMLFRTDAIGTVESSENVLRVFVRDRFPMTAGINSAAMKRYGNSSHIDEPTEEECSSDPKHIDHYVLIVGLGTAVDEKTGKETPFWIIKNSWGKQWGDNGFYYLVRGRNACGIANELYLLSSE